MEVNRDRCNLIGVIDEGTQTARFIVSILIFSSLFFILNKYFSRLKL